MSEENHAAQQNPSGHPYGDWMEKIRQASNPKPIEEENAHHGHHSGNADKKPKKIETPRERKLKWLLAIGIFTISLAIRLYFIFAATNPQNAGIGWYNDSYHHWQIAYLAKEIGFGEGFLRLWDLIGMEYFWGLLQPLILVVLFTITGSADIVLMRVFNAVLGSSTLVVLFLLVKKHFSWQAAIGAVLLAIANPIGIFTDTSGMQEPLAILLMLLGVYFWEENIILTGIFWLFASMARSEYWLFSLGLIAGTLIFDKGHTRRAFVLFPYGIGILLYMKYLLDKTGNAIYPIYWNFFGNAAGEWEANIPFTPEQEAIKLVFLVILIIAAALILYLLIKRPRLYVFSLLGAGNFLFLAFFVGFTEYLKSYIPRFWVDRIFWLPYIWLGAMLAIGMLYYLPKKVPYIGRIIGWCTVLSVVVLLQLTWKPIKYYSRGGDLYLSQQKSIAQKITANYPGGALLIPGNDPILTYALYQQGIKGKVIRGQMFDPYFYFTEKDPYTNWGKHRKVVLNWLKREDIRTIVIVDEVDNRYVKLFERELNEFEKLEKTGQYLIYKHFIPQ